MPWLPGFNLFILKRLHLVDKQYISLLLYLLLQLCTPLGSWKEPYMPTVVPISRKGCQLWSILISSKRKGWMLVDLWRLQQSWTASQPLSLLNSSNNSNCWSVVVLFEAMTWIKLGKHLHLSLLMLNLPLHMAIDRKRPNSSNQGTFLYVTLSSWELFKVKKWMGIHEAKQSRSSDGATKMRMMQKDCQI